MRGAAAALVLFVSGVPAPDARPPEAVRYRMLERHETGTPSGPRIVGREMIVTVVGDRARLESTIGTLPRSSAKDAYEDRGAVTLVDPGQRVSAPATPEDFDALFRGAPSATDASTRNVSDLVVSVDEEGAGRIDDRPTRRFRVTLRYALRLSMPGRTVDVKHDLTGLVESVEGFADARSAFGGLERLLPVRGEAETALRSELAKVTGFVVSASFEATAERSLSVSTLTAPGAPGDGERPMKTTTRVERRIRDLTRGPATAADLARVRPPDGLKTLPIDRIVPPVARLAP